MSIKGGKPPLILRIDDYTERKGGHQAGVIVITRDGIVIGSRRVKLTDPADLDQAAEWATQLKYEGADGAIQAAWNQAKAGKDRLQAQNDGYQKPAQSKFLGPARWVVDQLAAKGRFLKYSTQHYYFNGITKVPIPVDSFAMDVVLRHYFAVNRSEGFCKYLVNDLRTHAELEGEEETLRHGQHYDVSKNVLYFDLSNGKLLKGTGGHIEEVENATDGMMFEAVMYQQPWTYVPDAFKLGRLDEMIGKVNFAEGEEIPLTANEQRLLFKVWLLSIPFRSELPTRPIALAYGQPGSGKTTMFEQVGQIFYGPGFRADAIRRDKEDDFWTTASNRHLLVIDNADSSIPWLNDALAMCATGTQISRKTLYKTNEISTYLVDVFLAITARTPRFRREDVAERLLLFYLARIEEDDRLGSKELSEWIVEHRDELMSEIVELADQVLLYPRVRHRGSAIRMVDFASMAERIGESLGMRNEVVRALEKQRGAQTEFASEENPLIAAIEEWLSRTAAGGILNESREVAARELHLDLVKVAEEMGLRWHIANAQSLGMQFRNQSELLKARFFVRSERHGNKGTFYRIRHLTADDSQIIKNS